jgi:hypothetical protein
MLQNSFFENPDIDYYFLEDKELEKSLKDFYFKNKALNMEIKNEKRITR